MVKWSSVSVALFLSVALILSIVVYESQDRKIRSVAHLHASKQAKDAAMKMDQELQQVLPIHEQLVRSLEDEMGSEERLETYLCDTLSVAPLLYGVGTAFRPNQFSSEHLLFAPYCKEQEDGQVVVQIEDSYDYTEPENDWYHLPLLKKRSLWQEPHYGKESEAWVVNLTSPFFSPEDPYEPKGVALSTMSLRKFRTLMASLDLGVTGYSFLVSAKGRFIVHPKESYLGTSLSELAEVRDDDDWWDLAEAAGTGQGGFLEHVDELTGEHSWIFYEPITTTGWTLAVVSLQEEMAADLEILHAQRPLLLMLTVVWVIWLAWMKLGMGPMREGGSLVPLAAAITIALVSGATGLVILDLMSPQGDSGGIVKLTGNVGLQEYISDYEVATSQLGRESAMYLPTGLFVQSVSFSGSNDVDITGYLWQRYQDGELDGIRPGFIFPEAIRHKAGEAFRRQEGSSEVIAWYFETTLRQTFDYSRYPFDPKQIWLRIWHREFDKNIILIPDLDSYTLTSPKSKPGLEEDLVVSGWNIALSFFGYRQNSYSTNFGLEGYVGQEVYPELYFNILALRESGGALVVHFVLLIVVAVMLFAMMSSINAQDHKNRWIGFSFSSLLGGISSLFFVLIFSHIQLRQEVPQNLVYLEWFYFFMYLAILSTAIIGFQVATRGSSTLMADGGRALPKLLYWPLLASFIFFATWMQFT